MSCRRSWFALNGTVAAQGQKRGPNTPSNPRRLSTDPCNKVGLPSKFDGWVYQIVAQTIPQMTPVERPEALWQPILYLGAPVHHWVERFFWYWFTNGARSASSPAD